MTTVKDTVQWYCLMATAYMENLLSQVPVKVFNGIQEIKKTVLQLMSNSSNLVVHSPELNAVQIYHKLPE